MAGYPWNSGPQQDGLGHDFDDHLLEFSSGFDDHLLEFSGGFLPRRSAARIATANFALIALRHQEYDGGEQLISHMSSASTVEVSYLRPSSLGIQHLFLQEVKGLCHIWLSQDDLSVLDIIRMPGFEEYITQVPGSQTKRAASSSFHMVDQWLR